MNKPLDLLFIAPYLPSLIRVRPYNLIRALAEQGHRITLLALQPPGDDASGLANLRSWCESVRVVELPRWRPLWNAAWALPTSIPFQAAYSRSPQMAQIIQGTLEEDAFDVIHVEHLRGAELVRGLASAPPVVFDAVDAISLLFERAVQGAAGWKSRLMARLDLNRTREYEGKFLQRYSQVLVTSPEDRDALLALAQSSAEGSAVNGQHLVVLPNGVDLVYFRPLDEPHQPDTVLFSGKMSYHANIAAVLDLVRSVMPHVWAERPATKVWLVGKDPPSEIQELAADPRVTVTGTVPDIRRYVGRATVAVTPLRYGVGIQNKVLEAMAMGTPVVTTPGSCRALEVTPGEHLLVGDSAAALAHATLSVLGDENQRRRLAEAGRRYVEAHHDWDAVAARLASVYRAAMKRRVVQVPLSGATLP
jgi:sugar transferase (PEP-CTERM/EpsH1 system associated)